MTKILGKIFIFCILILSAPTAWSSQEATVVTDGAMVYQKADFDSSVIGYLRAGQTVDVSNKTFGPFYKVRFKQGVLGYISDVDIEPRGGRKSGVKAQSADQKINKSFISKRYFGATIGSFNFSEIYTVQGSSTTVSESTLFYGIKLTTPIRYLSGPFVFDSELLYHSGVPSYYTTGTNQGVSGQILILDASVFYSLFESRNRKFWIYVGAGPGLSYTSFNVNVANNQTTLTQLQFGAVMTAGAAVKIQKIALKFEPKYFAFKSGYFGFTGAVQFEF